MRSAERVRKCLLFGVDRTYRGHHETDALDPKRTLVEGHNDQSCDSNPLQSHTDSITYQAHVPACHRLLQTLRPNLALPQESLPGRGSPASPAPARAKDTATA